MKKLYNADHQPVIVDHGQTAVMPGGSHTFTDEQLESGIAGVWSEQPVIDAEPTRAELVSRAAELGIDVPARATKDQIAELIEQHPSDTQSDEQEPETANTEPAESPEEGE